MRVSQVTMGFTKMVIHLLDDWGYPMVMRCPHDFGNLQTNMGRPRFCYMSRGALRGVD